MNQPMRTGDEYLLEVSGLQTHAWADGAVIRAVDRVDLTVRPGEVLGLVGESGCGKSMTALSIMRLLGRTARVVGGSIRFRGQELLSLSEAEMTRIRGKGISMIFQQPQSCLDPVYRVGDQIVEALRIHLPISRRAAWQRAVELLELVGIPDPEERAHAYPHELSGGMAQRVMIAMALSCGPELLIADEPTTALDVTIQAQILGLLRELRTRMGMAIIFISHDLGAVAEMADRVAVMYAGHIVEEAPVATLFEHPAHPYTRGLIAALPVLGRVRERLHAIPGGLPDPKDEPCECRFVERCEAHVDNECHMCDHTEPLLNEVTPGHRVRCWLYHDHDGHTAPLQVTPNGVVRRGPQGVMP